MSTQWKEWVRSSPAYGVIRMFKVMTGDKGARYDNELHEVLRRVLRPDSSYVDIGANQGQILQWAVEIAPHGTHFAFEPIPRFAAGIIRRFPHVVVHQYALSDKEGRSSFQLVEDAPAFSGLRPRIYDRPDRKVSTLEVETRRLDQVLPHESVSFIKIDVEGGEYHVLLGARELLVRCRPLIVFEAGEKSTGQYDVTPEQMFDYLGECRYDVSTMKRWLAGQPPLTRAVFKECWDKETEFNFIAIPA